ncbi:MAG: MtrAB system histidine kinase MtrB [Actinomycetes bacterium]
MRRIRSLWRRSLTLRVVSTTLVGSLLVVGLLGYLLLSRVTTGLLDTKQRSSVTEATAGLAEAQRILAAADTGPSTPGPASLVDSVVAAIATRAGQAGLYEVLLLSAPPLAGAPERATNNIAESSIPADLHISIAATSRQAWTYTLIRYLDGRAVPGLVVGAPLVVPGVGGYELYYLFPLTQEQDTLTLVRSAVLATGVLLVLGLVALAWLLTRQVVRPVRLAARTAEQFKAGKLTERMAVRGEDDLAALATSFNQMAASLQEQIRRLEGMSRVQQRFVSDVSHELRTPLTTVRMAADVLHESRGEFDPATARSAELLQTQLDRFELLLADLLEISRFDAGAAMLDAEAIDLVSLARRAIEAATPLSDRVGSELVLVAPPGPVRVECDPRRVERIVRNLVMNAVEHGGGRPVTITVGGDDDAAALAVRDLGVGLKPGETALVFNRFWRADPARARSIGGTGLGLSIALEDARLHGGWLQAWGEPGRGSNFVLTLPRRAGDEVRSFPLALDPLEQVEEVRSGDR